MGTLFSMPFPRKLLNPGERVVLDLHPHWWFFGPQAVGLFAAMVVTMYLRSKTSGWLATVVGYLGLASIVVAMAFLVVALIKWRTTYFIVTSDRLIYRQGVVARAGVEIPLERVNNVNFNQSIFERLLGTGDLLIESGGQDGKQTIGDIPRPEWVQNQVHVAIEGNSTELFKGAPSSGSLAQELERLEALWERGTLTDAEFEEQKRRLLD